MFQAIVINMEKQVLCLSTKQFCDFKLNENNNLLTLNLCQTCMSFFLLLSTKMIFWRMCVTKQLKVATDFHFFSIL